MNIEDEDIEDQPQSLELKRHRSRLSSKRTREKERSIMEDLEKKRSRLYISNTALEYHNKDLREAIQNIKNLTSYASSSTSSASTPASENSNCGFPQQNNHEQYNNQIGIAAAPQQLQNNPNPVLPQQQLPQMVPRALPPNLNTFVAQTNPLLPSAAALDARILQSLQQQASLQSALQQAGMNRGMVAGSIPFPVSSQVQQQPVNLAAAVALFQQQQQQQQLPLEQQGAPRDDGRSYCEQR
ncbi:unnamed protein product [Cylindrotheca closterium]|uniref:BZIP domain-containing protein n=1 Tax=Cylindrotheca closterium TaxID=2856 RepID=A0AAD2G1U0_9STRA|nr:unnamed protein product [Cylindrotheca closterium]